VPNARGPEQILAAIKTVWLALNFEAYEARAERAGIDHSKIFMAVLHSGRRQLRKLR
jgi:phosphoenolpyruvate synthase/pyruvate phosphate dikinase